MSDTKKRLKKVVAELNRIIGNEELTYNLIEAVMDTNYAYCVLKEVEGGERPPVTFQVYPEAPVQATEFAFLGSIMIAERSIMISNRAAHLVVKTNQLELIGKLAALKEPEPPALILKLQEMIANKTITFEEIDENDATLLLEEAKRMNQYGLIHHNPQQK